MLIQKFAKTILNKDFKLFIIYIVIIKFINN